MKTCHALLLSFSILISGVISTSLHAQNQRINIKSNPAPRTRLKYSTAIPDPQKWPNSAPANLAQMLKSGFPDPAICCDLDTKGLSRGNYIGPDGGKVSVYKNPKNYSWTMKNGIKIWSSPASLITLTYNKHKVLSYRMYGRKSNWNRRAIWSFPDGSKLIRYYNPAFQHFNYTYNHSAQAKVFDFALFGNLLTETKLDGGFQIYYKRSYKSLVTSFLESGARERYYNWIDQNLKINTSQPIPLYIFEDLKEYNDYLQESRQAKAGGRGFAGAVVLCCGDRYIKTDEQSQSPKSNYAILMHEMTHNRLQQACYNYPTYKAGKDEYTGHVFSEGIAELSVAKVHTYYKDYLLKKATRLKQKKKWDLKTLEKTSGKYYYPLMFAFWNWMEQKAGLGKIFEFHKQTCLGNKYEKAAEIVWHKSLSLLFDQFMTEDP